MSCQVESKTSLLVIPGKSVDIIWRIRWHCAMTSQEVAALDGRLDWFLADLTALHGGGERHRWAKFYLQGAADGPGCLASHASRMHRRNIHRRGWPIGSGAVESAGRQRKGRFNPKSEIETGNLTQSLGQKRIEKISTDHFGNASVFSIRFCSNILRHLASLNFGIRVRTARTIVDARRDASSQFTPRGIPPPLLA